MAYIAVACMALAPRSTHLPGDSAPIYEHRYRHAPYSVCYLWTHPSAGAYCVGGRRSWALPGAHVYTNGYTFLHPCLCRISLRDVHAMWIYMCPYVCAYICIVRCEYACRHAHVYMHVCPHRRTLARLRLRLPLRLCLCIAYAQRSIHTPLHTTLYTRGHTLHVLNNDVTFAIQVMISYDLYSYDPHSYGLHSHGLYSQPLRSYGLYSYGII